MIKDKGFTLIELLAIIVILAIILAIAVPGIANIINSATIGAFGSDAKMVLQQIEYEKLKDENFDPSLVNQDTITNYNISNANYDSLIIGLVDSEPYIIIVGKNKWVGLKACGFIRSMNVVNEDDTTTCQAIDIPTVESYDAVKGVNRPTLVAGMTPIKWDGANLVDTTVDDTDWYNYTTSDKKWANAKTSDGSMWVWIPRYVYKISSGWHTSTAGTIDIQFSMNIDDTRGGTVTLDLSNTAESSNNKWTNHPAFTFGSTELPGIWVSKFEASSSNPAASNGGGNDTSLKVKSVPNVASWRHITTSNMFTVTRNMETDNTYGWGTTGANIDTHLLKNIEWGAATYLAQSSYGMNGLLWINPSSTFITGCAGSTSTTNYVSGCPYAYNTTQGGGASTTGNIYGIYDMVGGSYDAVAAYVDNGSASLTNGSALVSADAKYKDVYTKASTDSGANNYALMANHKGDAMYETSTAGTGSTSWYNKPSYMASTLNPWFYRGCASGGDVAGLYFFEYNDGNNVLEYGFRATLLVGNGL
jgi:prepilin-type N-terminal cleavage/methylation domain-containing protein